MSRSDLINYAIRMVVPLRHEFGCNMNVVSLLDDPDYARSILEMARRSRNQQLREQASYLERMIMGPRDTSPMPLVASRPAPLASAADVDAIAAQREIVMKKYQSGLR